MIMSILWWLTILGWISLTIIYSIDAWMWFKLENLRKEMVKISFEQEPTTDKIRVKNFPNFLETRGIKPNRVFYRGLDNV